MTILKHLVQIFSLIFDLVDLFLLFLDLFDPSFSQNLKSKWIHFFFKKNI